MMSASDSHGASDPTDAFTPTTEQVRDAYVRSARFVESVSEHEAEFERWLLREVTRRLSGHENGPEPLGERGHHDNQILAQCWDCGVLFLEGEDLLPVFQLLKVGPPMSPPRVSLVGYSHHWHFASADGV